MSSRPVRPLLLFLFACAVGTIGYRVIEGWSWIDSLWMVIITFTTIGYGEVKPLSDMGRLFTIGLIVTGLSVFSYALSSMSIYVLEGGLRHDWRDRRRRRLMMTLKDHYIVAGYGRLGHEVAEELLHRGCKVVVIDDQINPIDETEREGVTFIRGDASDDDILHIAGVERAKGLAVSTSSNAINILVTISARQLNEHLMILTRVDDEQVVAKARRAGASAVIVPHGLAGVHMAHGLLQPEARNFLTLAMTRTYQDLALEDIPIGEDASLHGTLRELSVRERFGVVVVAVRKANNTMLSMPGPDTVLTNGDVVVIIGRPEDIDRFEAAANPAAARKLKRRGAPSS